MNRLAYSIWSAGASSRGLEECLEFGKADHLVWLLVRCPGLGEQVRGMLLGVFSHDEPGLVSVGVEDWLGDPGVSPVTAMALPAVPGGSGVRVLLVERVEAWDESGRTGSRSARL